MKTKKTNLFWGKVAKCDHKNLSPNYFVTFPCATPYCNGFEVHCLDCGVYISDCECHSYHGMSGWSRKRRISQYKSTSKRKVKKMPNKDGKGPKGNGPRDGRGEGKGRGTGSGAGPKTGGQKGNCDTTKKEIIVKNIENLDAKKL